MNSLVGEDCISRGVKARPVVENQATIVVEDELGIVGNGSVGEDVPAGEVIK